MTPSVYNRRIKKSLNDNVCVVYLCICFKMLAELLTLKGKGVQGVAK